MSLQDRKRKRLACIATAVALVLLVVLVATVLGVTLGRKKSEQKPFKETFIARCKQSKGSDCEKIWRTFEQAYVGRDPCKVPEDAYKPLFELVPITTPCNKAMFWSKTKDVVHSYVNRNKGCHVTMEDTLLGSVMDDLTWCGKEGSNETFTEGCPAWGQASCENNLMASFWGKGSASFAEAACGDATVMLNGSISSPFDTFSVFGKTEVPKLNPSKVKKLTVVLVMPTNPKSNCSNASLKELRQRLDSGISFICKEVEQSTIDQCSSKGKACMACW